MKTAGETKIDDSLATSLGLKDLEQLKDLLKGQIEQELNGLTRTHMKRKLLDQLAAGHDFPVPPSMVEAEFGQIWEQLKHEATHEPDPEAALAEMESRKDDYQAIAERRVRLGLLLSEIGQANGIEVTSQEMNRLIARLRSNMARKTSSASSSISSKSRWPPPSSARRCMRTRSSTSCSRPPRSPTAT